MPEYYSRLTNKGVALLSKILAEKGTPNFCRAECGAGRPSGPGELKNMTALVDYRYDMAIKKSFAEEQTVRLNLLFDNQEAEVDEAFELSEIALYLRDDSTGEEALYAGVYFEQGDYVPVGKHMHKVFEHNIDTEIIVDESEPQTPDDNGVYLTPHDMDDHDGNPNAHGINGFGSHLTNPDIHTTTDWKTNVQQAINELITQSQRTDIYVAPGERPTWNCAVTTANEALTRVAENELQTTSLQGEVQLIKDSMFNGITDNPFGMAFDNLDGLVVTGGVWNEALQRIEC